MNVELFRDSPSGRVVPTSTSGARHWAFVPNPLPPDIPLTRDLVEALSRADRALGELAGLGRTLQHPEYLYRSFMRREAVLSSRIEGTQADVADLFAFESGQRTDPAVQAPGDVQEVSNYVRAMEFGLERVAQIPVSLRLLKELHRELLTGVRGAQSAGEFRRVQNWIGEPGSDIRASRFVPPPIPEMQQALEDFELYLHADESTPPLIRLALSHYQFETIHPFGDGNGRIGRLLIVLLLVHSRLLPSPLLYLIAYFERRRQVYYDLLLAVSQQGNWEAWIIFFLNGVAEQGLDAVDRARRLQDLYANWRTRLGKARAASAFRLMEAVFQVPAITIPQAARVLDVSYPAAKKTIATLASADILSVANLTTPSGAKLYVAQEVLNILTT